MSTKSLQNSQLSLAPYQSAETDFPYLSLKDLMQARDLYHAHLVRYPNVIATAVGRYRIRHTDSWPRETPLKKGEFARTLANSEVRSYSWPAILVFVSEWQTPADFAKHPSDMVPPSLALPDGRSVPICVIEAPREERTSIVAPDAPAPTNNLGPGSPLIAEVQGRSYLATVGFLVSNGHKVFALTNRHVTGAAGEAVFARTGNRETRVGRSAGAQLGHLPFSELYPSLPGRDTYINVDIGLVDVDDVNQWSTKVRGVGVVGEMADFSDANLSLSLSGCRVCGVGAASGWMQGEIAALFYRYKKSGGFEYVADLLIGPRCTGQDGMGAKGAKSQPNDFQTLPGDSGTLWMLEPSAPPDTHTKKKGARSEGRPDLLPLALQWGRQMLDSVGLAKPQGYALATLLSRACAVMDVDPVRDWNIDQSDTWGSIGHFSIATRSIGALSERHPKLVSLMKKNADIISRSEADIGAGDFKGMGSDDFVAMADVPDFFWKPRVAKQGHARQWEGPNHFADMDQPNPDGKTLLDLTQDDAYLDPDKWQAFYDTVKDLSSGAAIAPQHRGLLPFRVWQIFDAMVGFAKVGDAARFVCAGGVLTHYLGDACQPLHISYLHDGDPLQPQDHVFSRGKKEGQSEGRPLGQGVHSGYEDTMVFDHRTEILAALGKTPQVKPGELVKTGIAAARLTIELMRSTFGLIEPRKLVDAFVAAGGKINKATSEALWADFGDDTIACMQGRAHAIAVLWESAWEAGNGDANIRSTAALTRQEAMAIVTPDNFLQSMTVDAIGAALKEKPGIAQ